MSQYVRIKDGDKVREYPLRPFTEFTIADWKALCIPKAEGPDAFYEEVRRYVGIPKAALRRMSAADFDRITEALVTLRKDADEAQATSERIAGNWDEEGPRTIIHEGITYTVPQDLAQDTIYGQWVDMDLALDGATHEPEVMAAICACLLVEEGKEYEGFHTTLERFNTLPVRTAMMLTAFFFSKGERLRNALDRSMQRRMMSSRQGLGPKATSSTNDGEGGPP